MDFQTETPRCLEPLRAFGTRFAEVQHQKAVVNLTISGSRHIKPLVSQKDPGSIPGSPAEQTDSRNLA